MTDAHSAVEQAARTSYSKLVAYLAARSHDVAAAEDALSDAFQSALETWPRDGVPTTPEAWLLVAARRRLLDAARRSRTQNTLSEWLVKASEEMDMMSASFPDERLKLLFVCAHPAIDAGSRTPLMLQTVMGLDAARIAAAFLVRPAAMGQRLTRAKTKIRDAAIPFTVPEPRELPQRLEAVLEAIYAAYGSGWDDVAGVDPKRKGLAQEALHLGRLLLTLLPQEPEVRGLLALMLHCEARRRARRTPTGDYVPLSEQDTRLWAWPMIEEADGCLAVAATANRMGRFQLEAAIQSAHAARAYLGFTNWELIALFFEGLVRFAPTIGARLGRIAALAEARDPALALELLAGIETESVADYQPYWALKAHLLKTLGQPAHEAYDRAIALCEDPAMQRFLIGQRS